MALRGSHTLGSGDCLIGMFHFLYKIRERGMSLPIPFAEAVCFEHHFPRGWYSFERSDLDEAVDGFSLTRRGAKECDTTSVTTAFRARKEGPICAQAVVRDATTGAINVRYLTNNSLDEFLMVTPEQCILSKFVRPKQQHNDVIIATWTPCLFTIERKQNQHLLTDFSLTPQQRGDTTSVSLCVELLCCPLISTRVRHAMQRFVWFIEKVERASVVEMKLHLKQDSKMRLWILWPETIRLTPHARPTATPTLPPAPTQPRRARSSMSRDSTSHMTHEFNSTAEVFGDGEGEEEEDEVEMHRRQVLTVAEKLQDKRKPLKVQGLWPSFCGIEDKIDVQLQLSVEDQLHQILSRGEKKAHGRAATPSGRRTTTRAPVVNPYQGKRNLVGGSITPVVPLSLMPDVPPQSSGSELLRKETTLNSTPQNADFNQTKSEKTVTGFTRAHRRLASRDNSTRSTFRQRVACEFEWGRGNLSAGERKKPQLRRLSQQESPASSKSMRTSHFNQQDGSAMESSTMDDSIRRLKKTMSSLDPRLQGLDVPQRVEYNGLVHRHESVVADMKELMYRAYSQSLNKQALKEPFMFDLPNDCPPIDDDAISMYGFQLVESVPHLAAVSCERYLVYLNADNSVMMCFNALQKLVRDACRQRENQFLSSAAKATFLE